MPKHIHARDSLITIFWPSSGHPPISCVEKGRAVVIKGMRLLIVEDDPILSELWADLFTDAGAQVFGPYASTLGALTLLKAPAPNDVLDAALLDVQVRDGDSYPVARALRAIGIPFVFLSGSDPDDLPDEFKGTPFLHKPIAPRDVFAALAGLPRRS